MGDRRRRLEEHQAVVGAGEIHAPGAVIIGEGADVVDRIVAAQGKLEAVLPLRRPVAGPLVAAHLGQERIDVADEVDVGDVFRAGDRHRDLLDHQPRAARLAMNDPQARGTVGERADKTPGADRHEARGRNHLACPFKPHAPRQVDRAAAGDLAGDDQLADGKRAVEIDRGRLDSDPRDARRRQVWLERSFDRPGEGQGTAGGRRLVDLRHGKAAQRRTGGGIEEADEPIGTADDDGRCAAIGPWLEGDGIGPHLRQGHARHLAGAGSAVVVEGLPFLGRALAPVAVGIPRNLRHDVKDRLRHVGVVVVAGDHELAAAVEARDGGHPLPVGGEADAEHAPRQGKEGEDEIGIVTDDARGMAVDAVDARRAVGAGDNDLVEGRMAVEGGEPTAQGTGGD